MNERTETEAALAAMNRAAESARVRASRFGSRLAIWKDGAVVFVSPNSKEEGKDKLGQPGNAPESKDD